MSDRTAAAATVVTFNARRTHAGLRRRLLSAIVLAVCLPVILAFVPAEAAIVPNLYEASVPVAGGGDAARNTAFAAALRVVAVRASGRRDAADRLSAATVAEAGRYVQRFGDNPDGTLQVGFDSASIERVLATNNLPVWGSERPLTLIWVSINDFAGQTTWIGTDTALPESRVLRQTADLRGLPLVWPVMDMEDRMLAGALDDPSQTAIRLEAIAARYGADAVLFGRAQREPTGELSVRWRLQFGESVTATQGSLPEGIQFAADYLAGLFAAAAGMSNTLIVEVGAIHDLTAYAQTLNYLEGLTLVRSAAVENVSGDTVRFRLQVQGEAGVLARAIALGRRLVPAGEGSVTDGRLVLRYQPAFPP